jgi:hypothetical protein
MSSSTIRVGAGWTAIEQLCAPEPNGGSCVMKAEAILATEERPPEGLPGTVSPRYPTPMVVATFRGMELAGRSSIGARSRAPCRIIQTLSTGVKV